MFQTGSYNGQGAVRSGILLDQIQQEKACIKTAKKKLHTRKIIYQFFRALLRFFHKSQISRFIIKRIETQTTKQFLRINKSKRLQYLTFSQSRERFNLNHNNKFRKINRIILLLKNKKWSQWRAHRHYRSCISPQ